MNKRSILRKCLLSIGLLAIVTAGVMWAVRHNNPDSKRDGRLQVVASFYPLYEFAKQVGGNHISVTNITPPGAEPHDFEPTPAQLATLSKASVFIYNGGNLEPWVDNFLRDYKHRTIQASRNMALQTSTDAHQRTIRDPHFWLDPVLAQQAVMTIRDGLIQADPQHTTYYNDRAKAYTAKLNALDNDFKTGLSNCQKHTLITAHEAMGYVAGRYKFTALAIAGVSPDDEPSPGKLAELTQLVRAQNINYIFFETLVSPQLAATIAAETGAKTLVFDPLEGLDNDKKKQGQDYISIQRQNLANLRTALACD